MENISLATLCLIVIAVCVVIALFWGWDVSA
jgi:hypothetical protein